MAMYYYASKISAIACGTRCKQTVLQKSRGQRDRDKFARRHACSSNSNSNSTCDSDCEANCSNAGACAAPGGGAAAAGGGAGCGSNARCIDDDGDGCSGGAGAGIFSVETNNCTAETSLASSSIAFGGGMTIGGYGDGIRYRRRHSAQLDAYDIELGFQQQIELGTMKSTTAYTGGYMGVMGSRALDSDIVQYDIPKNTFKRSLCDVNFESSVLGSGGIMYINGRIVSGPLESLIEVLVPKNIIDLDKEFIFSFLLSSRLFQRPHELLGKLLTLVPDSECLESLVALLAEWTNKFPYDYRDERMMNHVKHIVARCSNSHLEAVVSQILSALLKRLTDLERHEADLRACQTTTPNDKLDSIKYLDCPTATQYAQILCRLEKKLAKHIGPEEFLQCSSNVLLDKQKKWDQPSTSGGPPGAQDPKKTCNLETYLDWSARLRLFVCNEILQCSGIRDRSKTVELWSGVAQYCLLVGNYNSATAILESLESPPIARLKITWSKLQVTCQQLDCMQRHAEGHGNLWQKQAIVLNENHQQQQQQLQQHQIQLHYQQQQQQKEKEQQQKQQEEEENLKTETAMGLLATTAATSSITTATTTATATTAINTIATTQATTTSIAATDTIEPLGSDVSAANINTTLASALTAMIVGVDVNVNVDVDVSVPLLCIAGTSGLNATNEQRQPTTTTIKSKTETETPTTVAAATTPAITQLTPQQSSMALASNTTTATATAATTTTTSKPNDWVVIPVFADIVKLALAAREDCLQRLPNGHININAFDRMAAIVGAFTRHMQAVKSGNVAPTSGEYELFCRHMQKTSKLSETELMMASFDCEEPNNAEKLMYDLN